MTDERLELEITGRVQGVGFRWSTVQQAERLGVRGQVANRPDGSVRITAEGPRERLEQLREWARQGPRSAHVDRCHEQWSSATGEFDGFGVAR